MIPNLCAYKCIEPPTIIIIVFADIELFHLKEITNKDLGKTMMPTQSTYKYFIIPNTKVSKTKNNKHRHLVVCDNNESLGSIISSLVTVTCPPEVEGSRAGVIIGYKGLVWS